MNYYPFHIGDYASATRHLSWDEDAAYRRLLDAYYTREEPLPLDLRAVFRLVMAAEPAHREATETVLREFFTESPAGWRHKRCDAELATMLVKREKASQSARIKWAKANAAKADANAGNSDANAGSAACEGTATNTNTNTNTKEPPNGGKARAARKPPPPVRPDDVDEQTWADWLQLRKSKSADVTPTVLSEARREAGKAGLTLQRFLAVWCVRGSQGLQAEWLKPAERQQGPPTETAWQRTARERQEQIAPSVAAKAPQTPQPTAEVIDVTARLVG